MPRKRNQENRGLPSRWRFTHGAYYYQVPPGQENLWEGKKTFPRGTPFAPAYKLWAEKMGRLDNVKTIGELLYRYALEVIPGMALLTQDQNKKFLPKLRHAFGRMAIDKFEPRHIYGYVENSQAKVLARREVGMLSHAFTKAVEWGYINRHPFKGEVRLKSEAPRDRYMEDWEIIECLSLDSKRKKGSILAIQAYLRIKLLTGMSQGDLLRIQPTRQFKDDGIHIQRGKVLNTTGKRTIYLWTPQLREAVQNALDARPVHISPYLFCTKRGQGYFNEKTGKASGWATMWQRFMKRVLKETNIKVSFTEHDLRAKAASDADNLEHARALLSHADSRITNKVYRRKPEKVLPLSSRF